MRPALLVALALAAVPAAPQSRPIDLKGSVGYTGFVDEDLEDHLLVGGSVRFYITRRFSIEPEIQYLRGSSRHYDLALVPNVVWDFGGRRIVPYVAGGVGLVRSSWGNLGPGGFSSSEGFVTLGGGVKIYVNDRWFVAPDVRIGFEPHIRFSAGIGYTWRR